MRSAQIKRVTNETHIDLKINLDGKGDVNLEIPLAFLTHMLTLTARHGFFDLEIEARGDVDVDFHHLVEDIGITLGQAVNQALGDKKGINRYGSVIVPMDEALVTVVMDLCSRPCLVLQGELPSGMIGDFTPELMEEFFRAFTNNCGATLHVIIHYGRNLHHIVEAVFKAFGRALDQATQIDERIGDTILSTKGIL
ncbi:MAG: imidazoleglycerol-phosphate dehydratase HisB [Candidatus Schekmanbacteria bacterium]|nr:imidazoleglycerol-phosphate dehydratase HisB [Candidatus Schekmanbacteria bacterium]